MNYPRPRAILTVLINSSFNYGTNILMSDNNFVRGSIKTLKYGYYYFQKSKIIQKN